MSSQYPSDSYFGDQSRLFSSPSHFPDTPLVVRPPGQRRRLTRRVIWFASLGLLLLLLNLGSTILSTPQAYAAVRPPVVLKGAPSKPNVVSPTAGSTSLAQPSHPAPEGSAPIGTPQPITHTVPLSMKAGSLALQANTTTHFLGSDGHLEVSIPATAISPQDLLQAGGSLHLQVSEIAPPSGSNAGGSGHLSLGTYLFQLVDANGVLVNHGLHAPITVTYHYSKNEAALNLDHAYIVENGPRPAQGSIKFASMKANVALANTFGALSSQAVQLNTTQQTLLATPLISTPSTSLTWQSDVSIGTFGKPDPFNVDLSAGGLTSQLPIDVPAGPGGLTPPVSLSYSSEGVNGQHNPTGAAGWVGEGWNLSMGSINWAEHNVYAGCTTTACGGGVNWENTWELSDPYGTSSELIPPNLNVSTYYDDSTNTYCDAAKGTNPPYPCPILWHTATETHTKIYAYVGPNSLPQMSAKPPCFRVWEPNGVMEEFGCTPNSLQHYYQASVGAHLISSWLLDLITDPQGNQIHFTYQQDNTTVAGTHQAIRDVALSTIEYDSPNCHNAQTMCTGANWNPLVRLSFQANHAPRLSGVVPTGCNTGANLRCDDPLDLSSSGGIAAPEVQSTFVLNDILVQVRTSSAASWNTLHDYRLGYEESGPTTITDPSSGKAESAAGMLDLTSFQQGGTAGANALMYSGLDESATRSYAYMKVFDLSSKNVVVGPNTTLSYWIYPQSKATNGSVSGNNSTCVAVDMIFTDGSDLRDAGAVDQSGNPLRPAQQCGHLTMDQWNLVTSDIGAAVNGRTISKIDIAYDQGPNTGGYRGYVDDISLSNPGNTTPLFRSSLESGDPQPTWTDTVDSGPEAGAGNSNSVGGICCGLTAPQLGVRAEVVHADSAALPMRTFTYTSRTNYYEDDQFTANSSGITKCGPSWNTGNGSGCLLWSQSYANNSRFLASASNGQGLAQTFAWSVARSNTHGVPGGGANNADPLYCNAHQSGYPCNEADDQSWSHVVLTQTDDTTVRLTQNGQGGTQASTPIKSTTDYGYQLSYPLASQQCKDCVAGFYWGNQNDSDYLSYYNNKFMGFAQATVALPSGAKEVHKYYATQGIGIYDTSQVTCFATSPCHASPWWNLNNAAHGHEYDVSYYDTDGTTLLKHTANTYKALCPPAGVAPTPASTDAGKTYTWDGNLVSELDHNNPAAVCDIEETQSVSQISDGGSNTVSTTTTPVYDNYGRVTQTTTTSNGGTPNKVVKNTSYVWNDGITATRTSATGTYIIDTPAFSDTEDGSGNRLACSYTSYDGQSYITGQTNKLTSGKATTGTLYTDCGTASNSYTPSGPITTSPTYDAYGNLIATNDADANAGIAGHKGCSIGATQYTGCTTYDSTFATLETASTNTLNQTSSTSYGSGAFGGYGLWPVSDKGIDGQTTSYTYDLLGRMTSQTLPGESSGNTTQNWTFTDWCTGTATQAPCVEVDETDRLDSSTTITTRAFYDGEGHLVEKRAPGPSNQDVVTYVYYDASGRQIFKSNSYFVAPYAGVSGPAAYSIPDSTQPGTSTAYPNLLQTSATDPNSAHDKFD